MSKALLNKLKKTGSLPIQPSNFILSLAEKENTLEIAGEIEALIEFQDERNRTFKCFHKFLVIQNLNHDVFIGNDIISSPKVYAMTPKDIIYNRRLSKQYSSSRIKNNPKYLVVPITNVSQDKKFQQHIPVTCTNVQDYFISIQNKGNMHPKPSFHPQDTKDHYSSECN